MLHCASNKRRLPIGNSCLVEKKNAPLSCGQKHTVLLYIKSRSRNKITDILKSDCKYASSHTVKAIADDK